MSRCAFFQKKISRGDTYSGLESTLKGFKSRIPNQILNFFSLRCRRPREIYMETRLLWVARGSPVGRRKLN